MGRIDSFTGIKTLGESLKKFFEQKIQMKGGVEAKELSS